MFEAIEYGVKFVVDPTGHYSKSHVTKATTMKQCLQGCGLLPQFMIGSDDKPLSERMNDAYQFGIGWQGPDKASFKDGVFSYPQDPDLYPYMKAQKVDEEGKGHGEEIYIYPYAQVIVVEDGKMVKRQRMD